MMDSVRQWFRDVARGWNAFWFTPTMPHTLALMRILAGGMLFYTHLVWAVSSADFLGTEGWLPNEVARRIHEGGFAWSYLWYVDSPVLLWILHALALVVFLLFTLGCFTRVTSVLSWAIAVAYSHRLAGAFFGLDQVNVMLAMYLMLAPCGMVYSLDSRRQRRAGEGGARATTSANVALRLIQIHLCVIYLFGGISKMRGEFWWDGSAVWYAVANLEYQSWDLTWLVGFPWLIALLSHVTVFWETFYCVLIWPRHLRPVMLFLAACVHGGIALFLGMITFGLAMLIANVAFIPPAVVERVFRTRAS